MKLVAIVAAVLASAALAAPALAQEPTPGWSFAIHGGAGVIERSSLTPEQDAAYRAALTRALQAGGAVLEAGGSAMDAVQAAIEIMEDDPLFNAGRGAVFTAEGRNELDAAMMDGQTLRAGSVAGLTATRHPIAAARKVMERSPHVMLVGPGADAFAASHDLEQVEPGFFFTERRWRGLEAFLRERNEPIPPRPAGAPAEGMADAGPQPPLNERKFGTVGAVALDRAGSLAAGTSTGGMTGKRWGRVGDAPLIGAGTYASNADGCAVSATGDGEYFIRATVARDICARIGAEHRLPIGDRLAREAAVASVCSKGPDEDRCRRWVGLEMMAAQAEIDDVGALGGSGGVIVMGLDGRPAFAMNTSGMYRGQVAEGVAPRVAIYADEDSQ